MERILLVAAFALSLAACGMAAPPAAGGAAELKQAPKPSAPRTVSGNSWRMRGGWRSNSAATPRARDSRRAMHNLEVRIRRPPTRESDLEVLEAPAPKLTNGSFLARALWLALDPFLIDSDSAHASVKVGDLVPASGVAEVLESRHEVFNVGSLVVLECGLTRLCVSDGQHARLLHPGQTPAASALGVLGAPGMAAYFGLLDLAGLRAGETVLVSAAANAAGAMAGQLAMLKGARAIGIAGTREKCDWVTRHARFTACINHGSEDVDARLRQLAPRGIDVYFDSCGGELLESIVAGGQLAPGARIVQNNARPADPQALLARARLGEGRRRQGAARERARLRAAPRGVPARGHRLVRRRPHRLQGPRRRGPHECARAPAARRCAAATSAARWCAWRTSRPRVRGRPAPPLSAAAPRAPARRPLCGALRGFLRALLPGRLSSPPSSSRPFSWRPSSWRATSSCALRRGFLRRGFLRRRLFRRRLRRRRGGRAQPGCGGGFGGLAHLAGVAGLGGGAAGAAVRGISCTANAPPCGSSNSAIQLPPGTSIGPCSSRPPRPWRRRPRGGIRHVHVASHDGGRRADPACCTMPPTGRAAVLEELVDAHGAHVMAGTLVPAEQLAVEAQRPGHVRGRELVPGEAALARVRRGRRGPPA